MSKGTFRKPDGWDAQDGKRQKIKESNELAGNIEKRQLIEEGKSLEEASRRIELIMHEYDDRPESLLQAVVSLTTLCGDLFPETKVVADKFSAALHQYGAYKVDSLDEAFGVSRPSHFRHYSEADYVENGFKIAMEVGKELDQGATIPDVFDIVGQRYSKSGKSVDKIYYRAIEELSQLANAYEKAMDQLLTEKPELAKGKTIRFSKTFLRKFMNK